MASPDTTSYDVGLVHFLEKLDTLGNKFAQSNSGTGRVAGGCSQH